jgi:hypothetical protein
MTYKTGYIYHIKDEYFAKAQDVMLMQDKEGGNRRPTYSGACTVGKLRKADIYEMSAFAYMQS